MLSVPAEHVLAVGLTEDPLRQEDWRGGFAQGGTQRKLFAADSVSHFEQFDRGGNCWHRNSRCNRFEGQLARWKLSQAEGEAPFRRHLPCFHHDPVFSDRRDRRQFEEFAIDFNDFHRNPINPRAPKRAPELGNRNSVISPPYSLLEGEYVRRAVRGFVRISSNRYCPSLLYSCAFDAPDGRIGRLMIVLQFMKDGLIADPLLSVSPWFEARRTEYQDHLASVSATGNWDPWVTFFASGVTSSAEDVARRVDRMLAVQAKYVQILQDVSAKGVIRDIVDALIEDQVITISMMCEGFGKTPPAVSAAIQKLVDLKNPTGPFGNYGRQFIAGDIWRAVTAPVGSVPDRDAPLLMETTKKTTTALDL
ncbi:MAG: cell filamentation protein Fic [Planctomycetaceae bacterium]|nr:cell filamentation protein Fic [Planctomycetaceae bacterium]